MENASKALIMAGSVLLSILIIASLVFMFNQLGSLKNSEATTEGIEKLAQYNKQIETFNRQVYGSELLSLCNLIDDYNKRQADLKGYKAIQVMIYTKGIVEAKYMKDNYIDVNNSYKDISSDFEKLQTALNKAKKVKVEGQTAEKLAGMKYEALKELLIKNGKTKEKAEEIIYNQDSDLNKAISAYQVLKSESTEFKNKQFAKPSYEYDKNTGRVTKIIFKEQGV